MKKTLFLLAFAAVAALASMSSAQTTVDVTVNPDKPLSRIDNKVYGHFLEHIYNSCNGGLWGELVWNRSFEVGSGVNWQYDKGTVCFEDEGNPRALFGSSEWTDYELTCDAKKTGGDEGFLILYRVTDKNYFWVNIGGWANVRSGLEFGTIDGNKDMRHGARATFAPFTKIETDKTYKIRLVVKGETAKLYMDDELYMESNSDNGVGHGCAGLATWDTAAEYSNVMVKSLDGEVLYDGNKQSPIRAKASKMRFWIVDGNVAQVRGDARNSDKYVHVDGTGSLAQENFCFVKDEVYQFSFWARGKGSVTFQGKPFAVDADQWTKFTGEFTVDESSDNATLKIEFNPDEGKSIDFDQASVMPKSWVENYSGFRPDLLKAIKDLHPAVIRWPGGCYASMYRWKSGIGPQDDRRVYPQEMWNDIDVNSFGIDEFVQMCRLVGAEPIMVVDLGTKQWTSRVPGADEVDWMTEAVEWVEYCNGPATSKWGAVRAKNGHPEPYGIKFFELDNEVHWASTPSDVYVKMIKEVVPRMKAVDPSIKIIACGSWSGPRDQWDRAILNGAGKYIDYLSTHRYDDPNGYMRNPYENQRFFESRKKMIAECPNPAIRMFDSEWNAQSTDWRTGLHAGGILNCFENVSDTLEIAAPALFLRHKSATGWDNAFVNFDQAGWFPAPNYVVMKLWRDNYLPNRVEWTSESPDLTGDMPMINVVASASDTGRTVVFKAVNNKAEDVTLKLTIDNFKIGSVSATVVTPELVQGEPVNAKLTKRNDLGAADRIAPKPNDATVDGNTITVVLPALSANLIRVEKK
ncbi:MAG: hypothetical protein IKX40_08415 [Thermoguttaceae bacterium]|nr:hypothetical protein [Thermoguttaceae bacterium]